MQIETGKRKAARSAFSLSQPIKELIVLLQYYSFDLTLYFCLFIMQKVLFAFLQRLCQARSAFYCFNQSDLFHMLYYPNILL
jgi:hypothetical protein